MPQVCGLQDNLPLRNEWPQQQWQNADSRAVAANHPYAWRRTVRPVSGAEVRRGRLRQRWSPGRRLRRPGDLGPATGQLFTRITAALGELRSGEVFGL